MQDTKGLVRYYSHYKHRTMSYYNPVTGGLWSEISKVHRLEPEAPLETVLATCDTRVLYFMPDKRGRYPTVEQYRNVPGITIHWLSDYRNDDKKRSGTLTYQGKRITFYSLSVWLDVSPGEDMTQYIKAHFFTLPKVLRENFQPKSVHQGTQEAFSIELLATPSQMGSDLLKRSLPYGKVYPSPEEPEVEILLHKFGQGRIEALYHGTPILNNLYCYDGRWMYAACLRHVPVGRCVHDTVSELALTEPSKSGTRGVIPGFYRAMVTVPETWNHIGLLPMETKHQGQKYTYPRTPGQTFETWATSSELALAVAHGWKIDILERIIYPDTYKEPEPLKLWCERLVRMRTEIADTYPEPIKGMIRDATRNMALHTVGSFHRYSREFDGWALKEDIPEDYSLCEPVPGSNLYYYRIQKPLSPLQKQLQLPQWAAFIWGLARRKLAEAALELPFESIAMLRVDAIWPNKACPESLLTDKKSPFYDNGNPGKFIKKPLVQTSGLPWPHDNGEAVKVVQAARGTRDDLLKAVYQEDEE